MSITVSTYDNTTGQITGFMILQEGNFDPAKHLDQYYDFKTNYVNLSDMSILPRADPGLVLSVPYEDRGDSWLAQITQGDPVTISSIPVTTTLEVTGVDDGVMVSDGVLDVDTSSYLGRVDIRFNEVEYLPVKIVLEVSAP